MKTTILIDYDCLEKAGKELGIDIDIVEMIEFLKELHPESEFQNVYAYVGINKKIPHAKDKTVDDLWRAKCIVRTFEGDNLGTNFVSDSSQAITLDAMKSVYENGTTNILFVANSNKLSNLATLLKEKGVTVETIFYGSLVDYELAVKSEGFIDLENFVSDDNPPDSDDEDPEEDDDLTQDDHEITEKEFKERDEE